MVAMNSSQQRLRGIVWSATRLPFSDGQEWQLWIVNMVSSLSEGARLSQLEDEAGVSYSETKQSLVNFG